MVMSKFFTSSFATGTQSDVRLVRIVSMYDGFLIETMQKHNIELSIFEYVLELRNNPAVTIYEQFDSSFFVI